MCATMNPWYQHRQHICMSLKHEKGEMPIIAYHDLEQWRLKRWKYRVSRDVVLD